MLRLGHKDFQEHFEGSANGSVAVGEDRLLELRTLLLESPQPPRVLRRMKAEHLQGLPEKSENEIRKVMPPSQAAAYSAVIDQLRQTDSRQGAALEALQSIRRVSLMPTAPGAAGMTDNEIAQSARLTALVDVLDDIASRGEKALVFVEYLEVQRLLAPYLQQRYGFDDLPLCMSGKTPGSKRQQMVRWFQEAPFGRFDVMLLSPKAGGVGLTLTAANHVIHLSRWWNPAVEDQCTDRIFRIGQQRSVTVHYPMAIHPDAPDQSFDVNLHALLERKRRLSRELLSPAEATADDLDTLLRDTVKE